MAKNRARHSNDTSIEEPENEEGYDEGEDYDDEDYDVEGGGRVCFNINISLVRSVNQ